MTVSKIINESIVFPFVEYIKLTELRVRLLDLSVIDITHGVRFSPREIILINFSVD